MMAGDPSAALAIGRNGAGAVRAHQFGGGALIEVTSVRILDTSPLPGDPVSVQVCGENRGSEGGSLTVDITVQETGETASVVLTADPSFPDCESATLTAPDADRMTACAAGFCDSVAVFVEPDPDIRILTVSILDPPVTAGSRADVRVCASNFGGDGSESFDLLVNGDPVADVAFFLQDGEEDCGTETVNVPEGVEQMTAEIAGTGTSHTVDVVPPPFDASQLSADCPAPEPARARLDEEVAVSATVSNDDDVDGVTNLLWRYEGVQVAAAFDVEVPAGGEATADATFVAEEVPGHPGAGSGTVTVETQNPTAAMSATVTGAAPVRADGGCGCGCGGAKGAGAFRGASKGRPLALGVRGFGRKGANHPI